MSSNHDSHSHDHHEHEHKLISDKMAVGIWIALIIATGITVWIAQIDLGRLNFLVAMLVATVKASLVALYFMGLKADKKENTVIFTASLLFMAIFFVLTGFDIFFRGDREVKGPIFSAVSGQTQFKKPWNNQPEVVAHGKGLFEQNCVSCHGAAGKGDGPAAAALNPHPRNFTAGDGWKNGRKPSQIYGTLEKGLGSMPAFASLPAEDRWALAHYVTTLGPSIEKDSEDDLKKVGVDPTKDTMGATAAPSIPIDLAIEQIAEDKK